VLSSKLVRDARVLDLLFRIDQDIAECARVRGCPCSGKLHRALYPRKTRGVPARLQSDGLAFRFSFCCALDGCRRRVTPPSVRFLGRRVYLGAVVVLLTALAHGATAKRVRRLRAVLGDVSERTLARWRTWWREEFPATRFWAEHGARLAPAVATALLPCSLFQRFQGEDAAARLVAMMRFLAPLTIGIPPSQPRLAMAVRYPQRVPVDRR
jgi:hypothetical protein